MPRPLADSAFLRVYALLALALLVIGGLALGGFAVIDQVRREHYREQLASAPMLVLTHRYAALPEERRGAWLAERSRSLDIRLAVVPLASQPLNYFERSRLDEGQTLVESRDGQGWQLRRRLPGQSGLMVAELDSLNEQQLRGLAVELGLWLNEASNAEREARLALLAETALPVTLSDTPPEGWAQAPPQRLQEAEVTIRLLPQRWAISLYLPLPAEAGGERWLEVGPMEAFEPMPMSLALLLIGVLLLGLAASIYLIVRGLESRMAGLEQAASRIAAGHLDTRVKVESGDFLGRLGMAFNGMAARVQSLLRTQQEMIRAVSHELRTPVARIRFAVQMVEDMTEEGGIRRQLQGIDADIEELDALVDEILTYARLGGDPGQGQVLSRESLDCREMAQRVVETLAPLHGDLELVLVPGAPVEVEADPRYLQRALQNLVANACRHANGRVEVRLTQEPWALRIDVEDNGPGVPVESREGIFKPFARLDDSRTRRSGGYGLGLSIVQKVMAWHGGSVAVDDSPHLGGARFSLLLPLERR
ncbi:HAMP domain-containing protein [Halomonas sp. 328]|nr:HAMP domain-containing protein [Halomonas sp. 328]